MVAAGGHPSHVRCCCTRPGGRRTGYALTAGPARYLFSVCAMPRSRDVLRWAHTAPHTPPSRTCRSPGANQTGGRSRTGTSSARPLRCTAPCRCRRRRTVRACETRPRSFGESRRSAHTGRALPSSRPLSPRPSRGCGRPSRCTATRAAGRRCDRRSARRAAPKPDRHRYRGQPQRRRADRRLVWTRPE